MKKIKHIFFLLSISLFICLISCQQSENNNPISSKYKYLKVPPHFPEPVFPEDNPYSDEKFELGRMLFYEKLLVKDSSFASCSHCMKQEHSFTVPQKIAYGYKGEPTFRNPMAQMNVVYRTRLFWDGRGSKIESPAYRSIFLPEIFGSDTNEVKKRLENHPLYPTLFKKAFGPNAGCDAYLIAKAIATFVRCFISGNSRYDKYLLGDTNALNESEKNGMRLFFSDRTNCSKCHSGIFFTDLQFHNTGTTAHYFDRGRYYVTGNNNDRGKFLTPSLRNVEVTYPYLHDGEFFTLEEILENYNEGGKAWITKDSLIKPLFLTKKEINDIIAFLKSLTDHEFLNDPRFKKPN